MRMAVSSDERTGVAEQVAAELRARGHEVVEHGAPREDDRTDWAWASEAAARAAVEGDADQAVVCCWTGTGASIATNKASAPRSAATRHLPRGVADVEQRAGSLAHDLALGRRKAECFRPACAVGL